MHHNPLCLLTSIFSPCKRARIDRPQESPINRLNRDVISFFCRTLDVPTVVRFSSTCRRFHRIVMGDIGLRQRLLFAKIVRQLSPPDEWYYGEWFTALPQYTQVLSIVEPEKAFELANECYLKEALIKQMIKWHSKERVYQLAARIKDDHSRTAALKSLDPIKEEDRTQPLREPAYLDDEHRRVLKLTRTAESAENKKEAMVWLNKALHKLERIFLQYYGTDFLVKSIISAASKHGINIKNKLVQSIKLNQAWYQGMLPLPLENLIPILFADFDKKMAMYVRDHLFSIIAVQLNDKEVAENIQYRPCRKEITLCEIALKNSELEEAFNLALKTEGCQNGYLLKVAEKLYEVGNRRLIQATDLGGI